MRTKYLFCILLELFIYSNIYAQLNFGLSQKQISSDLPISRCQKKDLRLKTVDENVANNNISKLDNCNYVINSSWYMSNETDILKNNVSPLNSDLDLSDWYKATVPGTILTTLVDNGVYPDPYWGINNVLIPDSICRMNWWYRTEFVLPDNIRRTTNHVITFNGINYKAQVWLNNHLLGNINGAFSRGIFNVIQFLNYDGKNILAVKIIPPHNPGIPHEQSTRAIKGPNGGALCLDGPTFISSEGWDWMPAMKDRNIGIWQDIVLSSFGDVSSENIYVKTDIALPDTTKAEIIIEMDLLNHSSESQEATVNFKIDDINFEKKFFVEANGKKKIHLSGDEVEKLIIKNPRLWWPNGYGKQNLYTLEVKTSDKNGLDDYKTVRFGIRELEYELAVNTLENEIQRINLNPLDAYQSNREIIDRINRKSISGGMFVPQLLCDVNSSGVSLSEGNHPYIVFKVNGRKIFCRGGNWGMDDAMKRARKEDLRKYFELHKAQNFNMIRNWTGESTQSSFYELCDEYGMLVFNDFWMSTEGYNLAPLDNKLFLENVREVIIRYRNHPSIAVWCPRNEGFAPLELEKEITDMLVKYDGTRYYIGNSRLINSVNSGPWDFKTDDYYFKKSDGFASEVGTFSVPTYRSLNKFMSKEDLWPIGDVWCYHDWHTTEWPNFSEYQAYIDSVYTKSLDAKMFCNISQIQGYDSYRAIFEGWNSKMWKNTTGVLLWMSHPAWPSTIWQTYTWDGETTGAFYGCKKACESLHLQYNPVTKKIESINMSSYHRNVILKYEIFNLDGKLVMSDDKKIDIESDTVNEQFDISGLDIKKGLYLLRLTIGKNKNDVSINDYWINTSGEICRNSLFSIGSANVAVLIKKINNDNTIIEVVNKSNRLAVGIKLSLKDIAKDEYILPVIFSEGYFNLLPGERRMLKLDKKLEKNQLVVVEGLNVD